MKISKMKSTIGALVITIASSISIVSAKEATAGAYKVDPSHSTVSFTVSHLKTSNLTGRFNTVAGDINLGAKDKSSVKIVIQTSSIDTNHKKRDAKLRGPDFFNAIQYPAIKFVSSIVNFNSKGEPTSIKGNLSMRGKTKEVILKVNFVGAGKDPWGGYRTGYDATTTIKRSDFGMNYMPGGIGNDIKITLNIEAIKT